MNINQRTIWVIVATILILLLLILSGVFKQREVDKSTYQAVFMTNEQVYFGRLHNERDQFMKLTDVYYVRLGESEAQNRLVKLGETEPHLPQDTMIINRDHVFFWENLQPDSPFFQALR